jgi:sugar/nucleoside kinase (ribokinase family)
MSEKITIDDIPESYYNVPCIHLGPVFNEINLDLIAKVREKFPFVSLDGQGFIRSTHGESKKIILQTWDEYEKYLSYLNLLKVDDTELKNMTKASKLDDAIELILETDLPLLVITRAYKGAIIFKDDERFDIPAIPTTIIDETGAGDTFITAFLLEYLKTNDCYYSGLIAASTASFKIANSGPVPQYTREHIIQKLKNHIPGFQEK